MEVELESSIPTSRLCSRICSSHKMIRMLNVVLNFALLFLVERNTLNNLFLNKVDIFFLRV